MPFLGKTPTKLLDTNVNIDGGNIDGTTIGATSAAAGTFTNLTATGTLTLPDDGISGDDVNGGTISNFASTGIDDNATSTAITIDASENVLINNTSFGSLGQVVIQQSADNKGIGIVDSTASNTFTVENNAASCKFHINTAKAITFSNGSGDIERMRIDSSGNVGINTTSPSTYSNAPELVIDTGTAGGITVKSATTGYGAFFFADGTSGNEQYRGFIQYNHNFAGSVDSLILGSAGTERMRIDSSGDLLLGGTTSYTSFLSSSTGNLQVNGGIIGEPGSGNPFQIANYRSSPIAFLTSGNIERMRIDSSGRVGIGITSPSQPLHLYNANAQILLQGIGASSKGQVTFLGRDASNSAHQQNIRNDASALVFDTGGNSGNSYVATERMRIDSSGNVLVGTTSASGNVVGVGGEFLTATHNNGLIIGRSGASTQYNSQGLYYTTVYTLNYGSSEIARFDNGGNLNLGDTTWYAAATNRRHLHIKGGTSGAFLALGTSGSGDAYLESDNSGSFNIWNRANGNMLFGTNNVERMRITNNGYLLLNTTSGSYHNLNSNNPNNYSAGTTNSSSTGPYGFIISYTGITGGTGNPFLVCVDNGNRCIIRGDGDLENANNSYGGFSDERLKSNIVDASSQIDDIMAVQVRSYTLNETGETHIGVVAQELEASGMSGLVQEDEEGMKSVKYSILYMKAIKALQEAVTRIETLEAEVAALKGE